jgi:hypothetical protein
VDPFCGRAKPAGSGNIVEREEVTQVDVEGLHRTYTIAKTYTKNREIHQLTAKKR